MAMLQCCWLVFLLVVCQIYSAASETTQITLTPSANPGSVAENDAVGTTVMTVSSSDNAVSFTLESQVPDTDPKIFAINGTSGVVKVADITHLDFEKEDNYILVIKATQTTGNSQESASTTVTVTVTDVNEAPAFAEARYTACVNKDSTGGTSVTQVTATDEDDGDTLAYSITDSQIFEVEQTIGTIKVNSDQTIGETPVSYNLTLKATDDDKTTALTGTTTVSINVGDPCPVTTPAPGVTPAPDVTPAPNFATTITASFCLFLVSVTMHLLCVW